MISVVVFSSGSAHEFQLMGVFKGWDNIKRQVTFLNMGLTLTEEDMKVIYDNEWGH